MPELPEVEVTKMGIAPFVEGKTVSDVIIHDGRLRWPVPRQLKNILLGQTCKEVTRRGKYLLFHFDHGVMLLHLGMTGVLRIQKRQEEAKKYNRVEFHFGQTALRLHDPRKFGSIHWHPLHDGPVEAFSLLKKLGVEPFEKEFRGDTGAELLYQKSRGRSISVKQFLLAGEAVVGVGNIYCSESLFEAKINPKIAAGKISKQRYQRLAEAVRQTLKKAIAAGGSSLRDFVHSDGEPGHFMVLTKVYDRAGEPCKACGTLIVQITQGQRSTYYCPNCQK
jgi:formamidopyrimidine-DNA glycosylase